MMTIKPSQVLAVLRESMTQEEILKMTDEEFDRAFAEVQEEIAVGIMEDRQDEMIYGNEAHERYLRSEAYEADAKQEQWDWLKNERG